VIAESFKSNGLDELRSGRIVGTMLFFRHTELVGVFGRMAHKTAVILGLIVVIIASGYVLDPIPQILAGPKFHEV